MCVCGGLIYCFSLIVFFFDGLSRFLSLSLSLSGFVLFVIFLCIRKKTKQNKVRPQNLSTKCHLLTHCQTVRQEEFSSLLLKLSRVKIREKLVKTSKFCFGFLTLLFAIILCLLLLLFILVLQTITFHQNSLSINCLCKNLVKTKSD